MSDSLVYLSQYYLEQKELDSAKNAIDQSLSFDSLNYAAYNNRAYWKHKKNMPTDEIIADFETSIRINPTYKVALFSLANYYWEIKDFKKTIDACNNYLTNAQKTESDSNLTRHINNLKKWAEHREKIIDHVQVAQAMEFYDSVSYIFDQIADTNQNFIDSLTKSIISVLSDSGKSVNIEYLKKSLVNCEQITSNAYDSLSMLTEIDTNLNYKEVVLGHFMIIKTAFKNDFSVFLNCLSANNPTLLQSCLQTLKPTLNVIQENGKKLDQARSDFKTKYEFTTPNE